LTQLEKKEVTNRKGQNRNTTRRKTQKVQKRDFFVVLERLFPLLLFPFVAFFLIFLA
jgi:hypothetical protein